MKQSILTFFIFYFFATLQAQTPPERTWYYNDKGTKTTVKERWSEDNQGLKHGTYIKYFSDGVREILGYYNHDKKTGQWEIVEGQIELTSDYKRILTSKTAIIEYVNYLNGQLHGLYKKVAIGNVIVLQGNYMNGVKNGYWKIYDSDEKNYCEGNYANDKKEGEWKNTFAIIHPDDINKSEIDYLAVGYKKGYKSIFKDDKVLVIYDDKGTNILEHQKQKVEKVEKEKVATEQIEKHEQEISKEFSLAMDKYQLYKNYYGDTVYLSNFLKKYPDAIEEYVSEAMYAIKTKTDNDAFYSAKNIDDYLNYQEKFPNGIHIDEIEKKLKYEASEDYVYKRISSKYFAEGNFNRAILYCELILKYNKVYDKYYLPTAIYYSLALWSIGNKDKAIEVIKPYTSSKINYSDGRNIQFMEQYWETYKIYKEQLNIDKDKETYKRIKAL
jgi:antitoxin component YwqK of YwqJK toxin-antitoxin module